MVDALAVNARNQLGSVGLPFATIQDGVAAAQAGDTLLVKSGRYEGGIRIAKSLTIVGASDTGVTRPFISGRATTPFPRLALGSNRAIHHTLARTARWLLENAAAEAQALGNPFAQRQFLAALVAIARFSALQDGYRLVLRHGGIAAGQFDHAVAAAPAGMDARELNADHLLQRHDPQRVRQENQRLAAG